jgi:hypothetical protein
VGLKLQVATAVDVDDQTADVAEGDGAIVGYLRFPNANGHRCGCLCGCCCCRLKLLPTNNTFVDLELLPLLMPLLLVHFSNLSTAALIWVGHI